eukprot:TRINITY_DN31126_c0_g1_i2.p1 TRINITY_DN31126_c0_g1~~TRINITY_DN31126_c0_g1_i2.p1  ORF type:complete len:522 (+),score=145.21 TRINITY_DN31126_c0_g1_i2:143-1708(+)
MSNEITFDDTRSECPNCKFRVRVQATLEVPAELGGAKRAKELQAAFSDRRLGAKVAAALQHHVRRVPQLALARRLPNGWKEQKDEAGQRIYVNLALRRRQSELPPYPPGFAEIRVGEPTLIEERCRGAWLALRLDVLSIACGMLTETQRSAIEAIAKGELASFARIPAEKLQIELLSMLKQAFLDSSTADLVCHGCGEVLQANCLDEAEEWRSFKQEGVSMGAQHQSRARADKMGSHTVSDDLVDGTTMGGSNKAAQALQRAQMVANGGSIQQHLSRCDKLMCAYSERVRQASGMIALDGSIVERALSMVQSLCKKELVPSRSHQGYIIALLFLACKEENAARTERELARSFASMYYKCKGEDGLRKDILKYAEKIRRDLAGDVRSDLQIAHVNAKEVMPRALERLQLSQEVLKPAVHVTTQAWKLGVGTGGGKGCSAAVTASSIYLMAWLLDVELKPSLASCATELKVTPAVAEQAYADMRPFIDRLLAELPGGFKCRLPGGPDALPQSKMRPRLPAFAG